MTLEPMQFVLKNLESVTVQLKVGEQTSEERVLSWSSNDGLNYTGSVVSCTVSGVTMKISVAPHSNQPDNLYINQSDSEHPIDFLEVTDSDAFKNVESPIEILIKFNHATDSTKCRTNKIIVDFDKTEEDPASTKLIDYVATVRNGYSILDIKCDDTYAGSDKSLLIIAKYANSIVYNSYLPVPPTSSDCQRIAFSNIGLDSVIIEVVSENEAFGETVPGYLAFVEYEYLSP
jgi:hypothetical protein